MDPGAYAGIPCGVGGSIMKVKVIRDFKDKHTNQLRVAGEVFECTAARLKEIQSVGDFVEKVPTRKRKAED